MSLHTTSLKISIYQILTIVFGVALLTIGAQITIPLHPVPITMQTYSVLFIGLFFNNVNAPLSVLVYLVLGSIGMPLFAHFDSGIQIIIGPRGGYLVGFLIAVYAISIVKNRFLQHNTLLRQCLLCCIGSLLILGCGYAWLARLIGMSQAFYVGVLPFIIPEIIKSFLLTGLSAVLDRK